MKNLKKTVINIALILSIIMGIFSIPVSGATTPFRTTPQVVVINGTVIGLKADGTVLVEGWDPEVVSVLQPMTKWRNIV